MNGKIRRIVVTIRDPKHTPVAHLRKAAALARASGASIELFHAIAEPVVLQPPGQETAEQTALRKLRQLERSPALEGVKVKSVTVHDYPVHEAIVRRAVASRADLVIAAPQPRSLGTRLMLRNTDWELIRQCPCPLLLIKSSGEYDHPAVLAAVDPFHGHAKPANLDPRLLNVANAWAQLLQGKAHVFHAYLPLAVAVPMPSGQPMSAWLSPEIENLHAAQVARALQTLATEAGIPAGQRHLSVGDVPSQLKRVIKKTNARIVVMGAISRSALQRLFIGSTAERVLDDLRCDVLIVKPSAAATQSSRVKAARLRAA